MTPEQEHRAGLERNVPKVCALARLGKCRGRLQDHHPIERQRIRHYLERLELLAKHKIAGAMSTRMKHALEVGLDAIIADWRNGLWLCEIHHDCKDELEASDLRPDTFAFASEYGLGWSLERDFAS